MLEDGRGAGREKEKGAGGGGGGGLVGGGGISRANVLLSYFFSLCSQRQSRAVSRDGNNRRTIRLQDSSTVLVSLVVGVVVVDVVDVDVWVFSH